MCINNVSLFLCSGVLLDTLRMGRHAGDLLGPYGRGRDTHLPCGRLHAEAEELAPQPRSRTPQTLRGNTPEQFLSRFVRSRDRTQTAWSRPVHAPSSVLMRLQSYLTS